MLLSAWQYKVHYGLVVCGQSGGRSNRGAAGARLVLLLSEVCRIFKDEKGPSHRIYTEGIPCADLPFSRGCAGFWWFCCGMRLRDDGVARGWSRGAQGSG